jgi:hypothetical protein
MRLVEEQMEEGRWLIWINGEKEGPYSAQQLRRDPRVKGSTPVWCRGMSRPLPLSEVPALAWILAFKDPGSSTGTGVALLTPTLPSSPQGLLLWILFSFIMFVISLLMMGKK